MHARKESAPVGSEGGEESTHVDYTHKLQANVPDELLVRTRWLSWKSVGGGDRKPRKIPYYADGGARGKGVKLDSPEDVARLAPFDGAVAAFVARPGHYAGLGFAVVAGDGIGSIDLDNCLSPDGEFINDDAEWVVRIAQNTGCYVERSPSGRGIRVFGSTKGFTEKKVAGLEAYCSQRFLTVTGDVISARKAFGCIDPAVATLTLIASSVGGMPSQTLYGLATAVNSDIVAHAGYQVPDVVQVGERNSSLLSFVGHLRGRGMSEPEILERAREFNRTRFSTPLDDDEVDDVATRYAKVDPSDGAQPPARIAESFNDAGNADELANALAGGAAFFVPQRGRWILRGAVHYQWDEHERIYELAVAVARRRFVEAARVDDNALRTRMAGWANTSLQRPKIVAAVELAKPKLSVSNNDLDHDPMVLGVPNGVVELRTGEFRDPRPEDLITRIAGATYEPKADCPLWRQKINEWTRGDVDLASYLQRVVGYCLTGLTTEQCFFFLHGGGKNGKTVFVNVVKELMGANAVQSQPEVLMMQRNSTPSGPTPELARLAGVRLVTMTETEEGQRIAPARVKAMTGGDAITARTLHAEPFDFLPRFKVLLSGNHKPIIPGDDYGMWRRIKLVPFTATIPDDQVDRQLPNKLRREMSGILNWAIEGGLDWQRRGGLDEPAVVQRGVAAYKSEMDTLEQWIDDECFRADGGRFPAREAYRAFRRWAEAGGYVVVAEARFAQKMADRGFTKRRTRGGFEYVGIASRPPGSLRQ